MDANPSHFPTLLIICVVLSIIFYSLAFLLSAKFLQKRQLKTKSIPITSDEELNMETYLTEN